MILDIFFVGAMMLAFFKGYRKGAIYALFSVVGFVAGLAAALKLSAAVAAYISAQTHSSAKWVPFLSFALVFAATVFLVGTLARFTEKIALGLMLGWANRIAGVLLYMLLYSIIIGFFLFYLTKMKLVPQDIAGRSTVYPYLQALGVRAIDNIGTVLPFVKEAFEQLKGFFGNATVVRSA